MSAQAPATGIRVDGDIDDFQFVGNVVQRDVGKQRAAVVDLPIGMGPEIGGADGPEPAVSRKEGRPGRRAVVLASRSLTLCAAQSWLMASLTQRNSCRERRRGRLMLCAPASGVSRTGAQAQGRGQ